RLEQQATRPPLERSIARHPGVHGGLHPEIRTAQPGGVPLVRRVRPGRRTDLKQEAAMIRYKEIAFVAYPVTDMARARKFYEGVLDLKPNAPLESETPQWIEYDIGPGKLGIGSSAQWLQPQGGACAALRV